MGGVEKKEEKKVAVFDGERRWRKMVVEGG